MKDDTVHLTDEANYSGNCEEKTWNSIPVLGLRRSANSSVSKSHGNTQKTPTLIKEAMIMGLFLQYSNIKTKQIPPKNVGRQTGRGHQCSQTHPHTAARWLQKRRALFGPLSPLWVHLVSCKRPSAAKCPVYWCYGCPPSLWQQYGVMSPASIALLPCIPKIQREVLILWCM